MTYGAVRTNATTRTSYGLSVDAELCNLSTNGTRLTGPFWYCMPGHGDWSLRQPSGSNVTEGFSYQDVTVPMEALLGDGVLDPGECAAVTNILLGLRRSALPPPAIPGYLRALALPPLPRVDTDGDGLPNIVGPFLRLQSDLSALPPANTFTDTVFSAEGNVFYRVEVRYP